GGGGGGREAEAAMLGQPTSMLIPRVLGVRLHGALPEGATATDLVLTVTQLLRERGVVGKFVEFHGPGLAGLPIEDRATIGNMSPEFGSTCAIFPIDSETLRYLKLSGRPPEQIDLLAPYASEQGLCYAYRSAWPPSRPGVRQRTDVARGGGGRTLAGPRPPQARIALVGPRASSRPAPPGAGDGYAARDEAPAESSPPSVPPADGNDDAQPDD